MRIPLQRSCGDCTLCCTVMAVREIGKPYYVPCKSLCDKGCGIYETKPESCTEFSCGWLTGFGSKRPDECGYVISMEEDNGIWLEIYFSRDVESVNITELPGIIASMKDDIVGVRYYQAGTLIAVQFPIGKDYPDLGESGKKRSFLTHDKYNLF